MVETSCRQMTAPPSRVDNSGQFPVIADGAPFSDSRKASVRAGKGVFAKLLPRQS
jgi:hypothetical protein